MSPVEADYLIQDQASPGMSWGKGAIIKRQTRNDIIDKVMALLLVTPYIILQSKATFIAQKCCLKWEKHHNESIWNSEI
jgi:hypothetical protein